MEIPVYMFVGFLESGKTTFIQDTLCDKRFNSGEKTLLLLCEEGEEEYDPSKFYGKNVKIETIDSEEDLTRENLDALRKKANAERVIPFSKVEEEKKKHRNSVMEVSENRRDAAESGLIQKRENGKTNNQQFPTMENDVFDR